MASELSAYEKERLETIKKNHEKLVALGLESAANEVREAAAAKRSQDTAEKKERQARFPNLKVATEATRVSKRLREVKPQYTGEKIDRFGEVLDEQIEKRTRMGSSAEEKAAARAEMMENARKLLEAAREKLRSERSAKRVSAGSDPSGWRAEAIRRWGKRAGDCNTDDWEGYVASREATPAPTSPEPLLQEHFADSPWKLLVACALMSRVSSHETKTRCIEGFFQLCPTPTALLDTDPHDVEQILLPLGLFDNRWRTLVEVTTRWLDMPIFDIGLEKEVKIWGAGEFTVDSYFIFAKDERSIWPNDAALQGYVRWRNQAHPAE